MHTESPESNTVKAMVEDNGCSDRLRFYITLFLEEDEALEARL